MIALKQAPAANRTATVISKRSRKKRNKFRIVLSACSGASLLLLLPIRFLSLLASRARPPTRTISMTSLSAQLHLARRPLGSIPTHPPRISSQSTVPWSSETTARFVRARLPLPVVVGNLRVSLYHLRLEGRARTLLVKRRRSSGSNRSLSPAPMRPPTRV